MTVIEGTTVSAARVRARMVDGAGVRLGLASAVLPPLVLAVRSLPLSVSLAVVLVASGAGGYVVGHGWSLLLGASAWAWWTGFALHDLGTLTLDTADLARLAVLVVLTGAAAVPARVGTHWTRAR
jgi:hypothetical protein